MAKKIDWKKVLQAGAYATDALSKGSAGGLGKAIVDSKIDLSGKFKTNRITGETHESNRPNPHKQDVNEWMPKKDTLGDFPNIKKTNYNV
mgnify:CR=1 FL=1|tara:strand:- start:37 stop:306 length:270 start_codon:yes stop_codon:yes gene_type:complete